MKKLFYSVLCLAASFMLGNTAVIAAPVSALASETVTAETAQINDVSQICDMFTRFIEENKLDAKCVSDEAYPQYAGTVVVEFNTATSANRAILEYAERNNIARTAFNLVPCTNGSPITTVLPGGEGLTTVTTTVEGITNIDQIREMLTKYITDNELDAKCVSDEAYPQYAGTVVVEFNTATSANRAILEYAEKNNIARTAFNLVPCINGAPVTTVLPDGESLTTVTTTVEGITNIEQIREMFTKYITDNELDAKCVSDETYPQYAGTVVVEFNSDTSANRAILEYAEKNNIARTAFNLVPCKNGIPITTVKPDDSLMLWGDANCDEAVDVADAVLIARFAAEDKEATMTDQGRKNADVTHDGNVDGQDTTKILQYIAKKIGLEDLAK